MPSLRQVSTRIKLYLLIQRLVVQELHTLESITVNALSGLLIINPGTDNQSVCEGNPITPIEYSVGNAASGLI